MCSFSSFELTGGSAPGPVVTLLTLAGWSYVESTGKNGFRMRAPHRCKCFTRNPTRMALDSPDLHTWTLWAKARPRISCLELRSPKKLPVAWRSSKGLGFSVARFPHDGPPKPGFLAFRLLLTGLRPSFWQFGACTQKHWNSPSRSHSHARPRHTQPS